MYFALSCYIYFIYSHIFYFLATIKQVAELNVGILIQCLKSNTVQRKILGEDDNPLEKIQQMGA